MSDSGSKPNLFAAAKTCLELCQPELKIRALGAMMEAWRTGCLGLESNDGPVPIAAPGSPARPRLVPIRQLPRRSVHTDIGRAALIHAVAHIEFNAINLALDAVYRFRDLPPDYYDDWLRVAEEEGRHFQLLQRRLGEIGHGYGDFEAHDGLWAMATVSADRPIARMALIPMTMEARGLDVTPGMRDRFRQVGDGRTADILEVILREEIGHVAVGTKWFRYCCEREGLPALETLVGLVRSRAPCGQKGPGFNEDARLAAGFSREELDALRALWRRQCSDGPPRQGSAAGDG